MFLFKMSSHLTLFFKKLSCIKYIYICIHILSIWMSIIKNPLIPFFLSLFYGHSHSALSSPAIITFTHFLKYAIFLPTLESLPFTSKFFLYTMLHDFLLLPSKFSSCYLRKEAIVCSSTKSLSWSLPSEDSIEILLLQSMHNCNF